MDELESARFAKEIAQAWEKVSGLMKEIPEQFNENSALFSALREAIVNYRVLELNRYKAMNSNE